MHKQSVLVEDLRAFADYMNTIINAASSVSSGFSECTKPDRQKGKAFVNSVRSETNPESSEKNNNNEDKLGESQAPTFSNVRPCAVCQTPGHKPKECPTFKAKKLDDRWKAVQEAHLCKRCLYPHGKWPCKAPVCGTDGCQEHHHRFLHPGNPLDGENFRRSATTTSKGVVTVHQHQHQRILFRIIPVSLHANGKTVNTFAFLDGGSDSTLLENSIAKELGVTGPVFPLCMQWTNGVKRTEEDSRRVQVEISGSNSNKRFSLTGVHTVSSLDLPHQTVDFNELQAKFPHLKELPVTSYDDAVPGLLIGLDNTKLKTPLKLREGKADAPVAAKTRLGWTLYGRSGDGNVTLSHRVMHVCNRPTNDELHEMVKSFFTFEGAGVGANQIVESTSEKRARELMEATTVRTNSGKFQTGLLWKQNKVKFPDSRPMAERRLQCLEKRLSKDPNLYEKVRDQMADYIAKGYAHRATEQELKKTDPSQVWYLPLGVVTNPKKPEKVRVVWDAAATVNGVSLNSVLLKGPDLLQSLPTVLCRFRQKEVAINADIKEMFHQVFIRPEDRQALRFLWRNHPLEPVQVFVMDVAIFGSTCSPCSAQFVKNLNASEQSSEFPRAAAAVVENHYVDDYLDSVDTIEEAVQLAKEVKTVHERGGFELRHWLSSSAEVLKKIGEEPTESTKNFVVGKGSGSERVLGMIWLPQEDLFSFAIHFRSDLEKLLNGISYPTKRELLSLVMSVFDPLGLVANFVIHGKVLVQDVWRSGIGWDEQIPGEIFPLWQRWVLALQDLRHVRIERCYFPGYGPKAFETLELHVFVDASLSAYAAAAYFRIVDRGTIRCCLVASKTKVAPLKQLSVPRLELQAAVIGARLMKTIIASHTIPINRKIFWSDSNTVLAWLRSDQRKFHQFVAFRVGDILEITDVSEWRKVPTRWNVSDEATKWGNGPNATVNSRWLRGPEFLYKDELEWPEQEMECTTSEEIRAVNIHRTAVAGETIGFDRFSKWERLLRTVGYVRRFRDICLRKKNKLPLPNPEILSSEELREAEHTVLRMIQREVFADEYASLESNNKVPLIQCKAVAKSSRIYKLCPFIGADGVIRKDGRIGAASWLAFEAKYPAILPKTHYVTALIIDSFHRKFGHANKETIVNEIRQQFHVSELRAAVGKVVKECCRCKMRKTIPQPPRMSQLPEARLTPYVRPFTFTGLDYFGPITVRFGRGTVKRWVALFTCLTTRAVHLEVAFTLSTESCKLAVRRFIARRGAPLEIYSDQGTNFLGARKELQQEIKKVNHELASTFTNAATQWKLNPPYAPHMGGIWERLVRSVKAGLAAMEMPRNPDEETFITALAEAESMVNTRPLTYLPLDSKESEALTPNHFLLLSSNGVCQPTVAPLDITSAIRSNWNHVQVMLDRFWNRWIKEYIPVISRQSKWFQEVKPIQVGDLVVVVNEARRNSWERGVVEKVYPGKDGRIRSANVRTATGILQRPLTKLAVLDVLEQVDMAEGTSSNTGWSVCATVPDPP
ncbi:uncharacterized protein LOC135702590 [Ochlerotatus camptorhynchus]|uniref:uncharacterized protein LOC135702590 n=1 Tax=Ochlerotatus camptorhynchus TaxID=644619 RepID=UPI0031D738A6